MKAYDDRWAVRNAVWTNVWIYLEKADINPAMRRYPDLPKTDDKPNKSAGLS